MPGAVYEHWLPDASFTFLKCSTGQIRMDGTGLDRYIAAAALKKINGHVVSSPLGQGSEFTITLTTV